MAYIVHTADIHFDSPFGAVFDRRKAELRRSEQRAAFSKTIDLASNADMLIMAGDIFDSENVSLETINFMKREFSEIPNVKVFIAAGNHDPYTIDSVYASEDFGDNVHVFSIEPERIVLDEIGVAVYGISFSSPHVEEPLLKRFNGLEFDPDLTNVLMMHGEVVSRGAGSDYNPIYPEFIEEFPFDYAALGHVHSFSGINKFVSSKNRREIYAAYPGVPEPRNFGECGEKGVIAGNIKAGDSDLKFVRICRRCFRNISVDITGTGDNQRIYELILSEIEKYDKDDIFRIDLTGTFDEDFTPDLASLSEQLKDAAFYLEIEDGSDASLNYLNYKDETGLRGVFVRMMMERLERAKDEDEKRLVNKAIAYGLGALSGGE